MPNVYRFGLALDQATQESVARAQLNGANRTGERIAAITKKALERRRKILPQFKEGETVTNGKRNGKIVSIDTNRAVLNVAVLPTCRPERWAPDFVTKVSTL